jgi:glycosyltransferase involved in cell wall biosynthesis
MATAADLAETARIVAELAEDTTLLIDGLAFGAMPKALVQGFARPIIALCHHPLALEAGLPEARQADLKASETDALALSDAVIVTSPATCALLERDFGVPRERITVALPGTDPARRSRGTGAPLQLLAVGSVVPRKGYDVLVRALGRLRDHDWRLTIAGADDRSPETTVALRALVSALDLEGRVTVAGALSEAELGTQYSRADVFVMSSLFEGYGMALAEAMARGLPIVCTTGGAAADTVPADAALKVPPGDADAFANALRRVMSEPDLRAAVAEASWNAGQKLPRWEDTARIIARVVRRVTA